MKIIDEKIKELIGTKLCRLISKYFKDSTYMDSTRGEHIKDIVLREKDSILLCSQSLVKALKYKNWYIKNTQKI